MALSRAAAAAARKVAKSRGLKGNRADDGSMLTAKQTAEVDKAMAAVDAYDNMRAKEARKPLTAEEISYKESLEGLTPDEFVNEINRLDSRIADAELEGDVASVARLERQSEIAWEMYDDAFEMLTSAKEG